MRNRSLQQLCKIAGVSPDDAANADNASWLANLIADKVPPATMNNFGYALLLEEIRRATRRYGRQRGLYS